MPQSEPKFEQLPQDKTPTKKRSNDKIKLRKDELAAFGFNSEKAIEYLIEFKPETIKLHITSLKEAGFENPVQLRRRLQNNT